MHFFSSPLGLNLGKRSWTTRMVWDSNTNVRRLNVRKGSLGFEINVPSSHKYMLIKTLYCILTHKCHFSCVFLSNGFKANFPLRIVIPRNDVHDISVLFIERTGKRCMIKNKEHFIEGSGSLIARQGAMRSAGCIRRRMCSGLFKHR